MPDNIPAHLRHIAGEASHTFPADLRVNAVETVEDAIRFVEDPVGSTPRLLLPRLKALLQTLREMGG